MEVGSFLVFVPFHLVPFWFASCLGCLARLFFLRVAFSPSVALPSPSLRCADPVSCGGAAPFRGVLRVPQLDFICLIGQVGVAPLSFVPHK